MAKNRDVEFPAGWDNMSPRERSTWLASWMDQNTARHAAVGAMNRAKAKAEWDAYRTKNGRGSRRK
jgi:hypothetical protein